VGETELRFFLSFLNDTCSYVGISITKRLSLTGEATYVMKHETTNHHGLVIGLLPAPRQTKSAADSLTRERSQSTYENINRKVLVFATSSTFFVRLSCIPRGTIVSFLNRGQQQQQHGTKQQSRRQGEITKQKQE
jgi:hypothetical protein